MATYGVQPGGGWGPVSPAGEAAWCWRRAPWSSLDSPFGRKLARIALGAAAVVVTIKLINKYKRKQRRQKWAEAGQDVVVLHTFQRTTTCPNMSSFALKVETFCRMAGIVYIIDTEEPMGNKGKSPWITINGKEVDDSELIIDYLEKHFSSPMQEATSNLSSEQKAVGRCTQLMLDEHAMGLMSVKRYIFDKFEYMIQIVPEDMRCKVQMYRWLFSSSMKKAFYIKGVGRFSEQEVLFFLYRDLQALADLLGKKPYLLGAQATTYDAAVFSVLTQALCACAPEVEVHVREKHDNLVQYFDRMKGKYWADWNEVLAK